MRFLKIFGVTLVLSYLFVFFGGWTLFDFSRRMYLAASVWALIISIIVYVFYEQQQRIEALEQQVKSLEENQNK